MQATPIKKILIVVPTLECGGLERNVSIICNNIDSSKYDVTLAVLNNSNPFFTITNPGINVIDLGIKNVRKSLLAIVKLSKKINPDIILTTANHLNLYLSMFKWMFPKRIKLIARESSIVSINTEQAPFPKLYHWLLRRFYKNTDLIICQSEFMRTDLLMHYHIPESKMRIIYNSVNPPLTKVDEQNENTTVQLITVARLSAEKGLDRLIRAVSHIKIPYRFTIIGEGNKRAALQDLINSLSLQQKVFLAGNYENPFAVVSAPSLFLMGSHYEGFPNAMLEALAAGIPVVAFNAPGGIKELLVNNENGILVESNDEKVFAEAVTKALKFPFNREKIKASTLERFNINTIMKQWYDIFDTI